MTSKMLCCYAYLLLELELMTSVLQKGLLKRLLAGAGTLAHDSFSLIY